MEAAIPGGVALARVYRSVERREQWRQYTRTYNGQHAPASVMKNLRTLHLRIQHSHNAAYLAERLRKTD
jgi:cystathionine beta-lyase/cystathionine gamma-synthase